MKKVLFVGALALVSLASCKKEYTCECTDANGNVTTETNKGKDAKDACDDASSAVTFKVCTPK